MMLSRLTLSLLFLYISAITSYITFHEGLSQLKNTNTLLRLRSSNKLCTNAMSDTSPQSPRLSLSNANITSIIKNTGSFGVHNIPLTAECEQLNITSIYLNIDKVKGVYFAKDVKNIIFTSLDNLSELYYYDRREGGVIYKVSNKTRINMKDIQRFVFQSFNNNVDGILF
jgi:hypothetical protein